MASPASPGGLNKKPTAKLLGVNKKSKEAKIKSMGNGRVNKAQFNFEASKLPAPQPPLEMTQKFHTRLPTVGVVLHQGAQISKMTTFVTIRMGVMGAVQKSTISTRTTDPQWNFEFPEFTIEFDSSHTIQPFLTTVWVYSINGKGESKPIGYFEVDLVQDLEMRCKGDTRKFWFPLNTTGKVSITFTALRDFTFPTMNMANVDGPKITSHLPFKPKCVMELTVYQCVGLSGLQKLQSGVNIIQHTVVQHANHTSNKPATSSKCIQLLRTNIRFGHSPFWMETCRFEIQSKQDSLRLVLFYLLGEDRTFYNDGQEQEICVLKLSEFSKYATAEETRRWFAFPGVIGGAIGLGFKALSDMSALQLLDGDYEDPTATNRQPQKPTQNQVQVPPGSLSNSGTTSSPPVETTKKPVSKTLPTSKNNKQNPSKPKQEIIFQERVSNSSAEERYRTGTPNNSQPKVSAEERYRSGSIRGGTTPVPVGFKSTATNKAVGQQQTQMDPTSTNVVSKQPAPLPPALPEKQQLENLLLTPEPNNKSVNRNSATKKRPQFLGAKQQQAKSVQTPISENGTNQSNVNQSTVPSPSSPLILDQPITIVTSSSNNKQGSSDDYWEDWDDQHPDIPYIVDEDEESQSEETQNEDWYWEDWDAQHPDIPILRDEDQIQDPTPTTTTMTRIDSPSPTNPPQFIVESCVSQPSFFLELASKVPQTMPHSGDSFKKLHDPLIGKISPKLMNDAPIDSKYRMNNPGRFGAHSNNRSPHRLFDSPTRLRKASTESMAKRKDTFTERSIGNSSPTNTTSHFPPKKNEDKSTYSEAQLDFFKKQAQFFKEAAASSSNTNRAVRNARSGSVDQSVSGSPTSSPISIKNNYPPSQRSTPSPPQFREVQHISSPSKSEQVFPQIREIPTPKEPTTSVKSSPDLVGHSTHSFDSKLRGPDQYLSVLTPLSPRATARINTPSLDVASSSSASSGSTSNSPFSRTPEPRREKSSLPPSTNPQIVVTKRDPLIPSKDIKKEVPVGTITPQSNNGNHSPSLPPKSPLCPTIECYLCKAQFEESQTKVVQGKSFCPSCLVRIVERLRSYRAKSDDEI